MWFTSRWVPLILKRLKFHHRYRHRWLSESQRSSKCFQTSECRCRGGPPPTTKTTFPQYFPRKRKLPIPLTSRHHPMGFRKQMDHQELCEYVEAKFAVWGFISWRFHGSKPWHVGKTGTFPGLINKSPIFQSLLQQIPSDDLIQKPKINTFLSPKILTKLAQLMEYSNSTGIARWFQAFPSWFLIFLSKKWRSWLWRSLYFNVIPSDESAKQMFYCRHGLMPANRTRWAWVVLYWRQHLVRWKQYLSVQGLFDATKIVYK